MAERASGTDGPRQPAAPRGPGPTVFWIIGIAAALGIGYLFRSLVLPFILAALLAYLLNPLVAWAEEFAIRRSAAVTALFLCAGLFAVVAWFLVFPRVRDEGMAIIGNLPALSATLEKAIDAGTRELVAAYPALGRVLGPWESGWLERVIEQRAGRVSEVLAHAGSLILVVVLVPVFTFFLLRDSGRMVTFLLDRLHPAHIETSVAVWCEIDRIIGRYLRGLTLEAVTVGILAGVGLRALGVPYPWLLGAFTALVNPLPYLGSVLSLGAACLVSLAHGQALAAVGWKILLLYLVIRLLDDVVIAAVAISGSVHLHPMLVLVSIIAGEQAFGLLGMVIAVPLVTVIKEIARLLLEHRRTLTGVHLPGPALAESAAHFIC